MSDKKTKMKEKKKKWKWVSINQKTQLIKPCASERE